MALKIISLYYYILYYIIYHIVSYHIISHYKSLHITSKIFVISFFNYIICLYNIIFLFVYSYTFYYLSLLLSLSLSFFIFLPTCNISLIRSNYLLDSSYLLSFFSYSLLISLLYPLISDVLLPDFCLSF